MTNHDYMKWKITFLFAVTAGFFFRASAQVIKVVDYENKAPIPQVTVYQSRGKVYLHTNDKGEVDITVFHMKDTLYFSHPDYVAIRLTKQQIVENKYRVELYRNLSVLNTIVLSVSRNARQSLDIPREVQVFDAAQIEERVVSEIPELLLEAPGVSVQRTQGGAGSPVIRGLEANRVLLVIDGVRMNNAIYHSGHMHQSITVQPAILERVEIISGPSAIYGSDALGGIIHFITKTPVVNNPKKFQGGFMGRYATATGESTFHLDWTVSDRKWASLTSLTYSDYDDIRMGTLRLHGYDDWGIVREYSDNTETHYNENPVRNADLLVQPNTAYKQYDFFNKTVVELDDRSQLIFDTQFHTTSDIPRFDKLTEYSDGHLKYAEWRYGPMQRFMFSPRWVAEPGREWLDKFKLIAAYQNIKESRIKRNFGSLTRKYQKENLHVWSLNGDAETDLENDYHLNYGFELMYNNLDSKAYGTDLIVDGNSVVGYQGYYYVPTRYPNDKALYTDLAVYADVTKRFSEKHFLEAGMRFTQTYLYASWTDLQLVQLPFQKVELANFAFTPMVSYIYSPQHWRFTVHLGSGFRSPNIDDVGKIREKSGKLLVPNTGLKPEYSYYSELGVERKIPQTGIDLKAYAYYNLLYNYIDRQPFTLGGLSQIVYDGELVDVYANVNNGTAHIYGWDFIGEWRISPQVKWHADMSWIKGRKQNGEPMPSIPPFKLHSFVEINNDYFDFILSTLYYGKKPVDEYDVIGGADNLEQSPVDPVTGEYVGFPSWYIVNMYFKLHISPKISLDLGVENVFDVHYKRFASAVSEPGRNFKIQLSGKF